MIVVRTACALGALVLVSACDTPNVSANVRTGTARDSAEQVVYGARSVLASNGIRRGQLSGDTVMVFDAATRFVFQGLHITFSTALGRPLSQLTARNGTYRIPGGVVAEGKVVIASDTLPRRLDGAWVRYDPATDRLSSENPFTATAGSRRLSGTGFTADPGLFTIKCAKQCAGSLGP